MSRHLKRSSSALSLLLLPALLILCCSSGGTVHAQVNQEPVNPFGGAAPTSLVWEGVTCAGGKVKSVSAPSLVKVNGDVFAVAKVECTKDGGASESVTGIAAMLLPEGGGDVTQISMTGSGNVCVHTLKDNTEGGEKKTVQNIMTPTTIVSGSHIYMLLGTPSQATSSQSSDSPQKEWGLLLVKGEVEQSEGAKKIKWSNPSKVQYETKTAGLTQLEGAGGSGIIMRKDNTPAFPMQATKDGKTVFVVMYWSKSENKWKLSKEVEDVEGCSDPAIVEWEEENGFLMVTPCAKGSYDVFRSTYLGNGWLNTDVPLTRVWGTSQKRQGKGVRSGFITTTIEGRKVLLVTLPVYSEGGNGRLHLFLTDNAHVYDVGPVSTEGDDAAASNLLLHDDKLIVVYEKKNTDASSTATNLVSVRLTQQLEQIKTVVKSWDEKDKSLKECKGLTGGSPAQGMCNGPVITKGLVGVLSGTYTADGNEWKDEYLCVNATVKGTVTKTDKGLKFQGSGAGAEWPVGKVGQNQPYYFANNQFTLVATVIIDEVPKEDSSPIPLIGVKMNDTANTALFGVSYSHDNKWVPVLNNKKKESVSEDTWEEGKEYQVALTMKVNEWSVYIDGDQINEDTQDEEDDDAGEVEKLFKSHRISHFYIGGYGDETSGAAENRHVTVTNVMLYNRLLTTGELRKPVKSKSTIPPPVVGNEPVQQPQEVPQPQSSKPTGAIHSDVSPAPEQAQEKLEVQPKEGDNGENKTVVVNGPAARPEGDRKQDTQNNVDNSERPAAGEEKNPALQVDEKEEEQGEPRIAEGNAEEEEGEEERRPDPQLAPATEEENVGAEKNNAALPPSDAQQEPKDGVDSNNQPDIAPAPAPVNDAELNNTVKQSGNQGVKPSGPSPRPSWNGNADGAVSMSAPHGFLLLFLGLLVFGIMC